MTKPKLWQMLAAGDAEGFAARMAEHEASHHFASGDEHALVEEADDGETQQAWQRMLERVECGIEPCDDSDACVEYAESDENVQVTVRNGVTYILLGEGDKDASGNTETNQLHAAGVAGDSEESSTERI